MQKAYLVFDLGTGNSKVALVAPSGDILAIKSLENSYARDCEYADAQYFLPGRWKNHLLTLCLGLLKENPDTTIFGITASGARESVVLYDSRNNAFLGLPNIDNRGRQWIDEIPNKEYIYKRTGRWVTEDFPAAKLLGLRKIHPEQYDRIAKLTSLSEWIGEIFTGKIAIEPSQACETQLFDIGTMQWSEELCRYYGIDMKILPVVKNSGTLLGTVTPEIAKELKISANIPFIIGGGDTQIAVKSSENTYNDVIITSGTTSPVVTVLDHKFYDPAQRCWTDCNLAGKGYQIETNPGVTGLNYQTFKNNFFPDVSYREIESKLADKKSFCCTASFSSLLFHERKSLRKGGFTMRSPLSAEFDRYDMAWAVIADIACSIYQQYRNLCEMIPHTKPYILGCGGGFKTAILCQLLTDLTEKELILRRNFDKASAAGCAAICNDYFGAESKSCGQEEMKYRPQNDELIHSYYDLWNTNRTLLNK